MFVNPEFPAPGPHVLEAYDPAIEYEYAESIIAARPASLPEAHAVVAHAQSLSDRLHGMAGVSDQFLQKVDDRASAGLDVYRQSTEEIEELNAVKRGGRPDYISEEDWDGFSDEDKKDVAQDARRQIRLSNAVVYYQKSAEIADLLKVNAYGKVHRPSKYSGRGAWYLPDNEIDLLRANQEQVREGIGLRTRAADAIAQAVLPPLPEPPDKIVGIEQPVDRRQPFGGLDPDLRKYYLARKYAAALQSAANPVPIDGAAPRPVEHLLDGPLQEYLNGQDTDDGTPVDRAKRARIVQEMIAYLGRSLPKK